MNRDGSSGAAPEKKNSYNQGKLHAMPIEASLSIIASEKAETLSEDNSTIQRIVHIDAE